MIDSATVERIKEAANIVEVVSEFVTLRKSGANYKGLCPFHEEKTPSFHVSPARGICHCFGCGKGGNAIYFIMEHEQMSYPEALRWLANKYHIEIKERELSDEEKREQSARESMFIVNEWAAKHFEDLLYDNRGGTSIGMQYFRSRGFRDDTIRKFNLGYDLPDRKALATAALAAGYKEEFLVKTGLCYKTDRGDLIDRYAGRVIFPWYGISGKVVGFGGRLLDSRTKGVAQKYVNSPDSDIYHKDRELYGIFQAKKAIAKEDRVYMVEGYTDVISMHQCGIENVVANSGTALSNHQIHILHRFTQNITLLYDGDAAGIHAALRGTDMLLAEGMNLKVLLLPDGEDPDSFARKNTAADFKKYIEEHQTDFIQFKSDLLLKNERDPLKRSEAINSVVKSISMVQDQILRDTYLHDCSARFGIGETTLINTMNNFIRLERSASKTEEEQKTQQPPQQTVRIANTTTSHTDELERLITKLVIRHGDTIIYKNVACEDGSTIDLNVAQYVRYNLGVDNLHFANTIFERIVNEAADLQTTENSDIEQHFIHHDDIDVSRVATELCIDPYRLMGDNHGEEPPHNEKEKQQREEERLERLRNDTDHLLNDYRLNLLEQRMKQLKEEITACGNDTEKMQQLMEEYTETHKLRSKIAHKLGNNIFV